MSFAELFHIPYDSFSYQQPGRWNHPYLTIVEEEEGDVHESTSMKNKDSSMVVEDAEVIIVTAMITIS